MAQEKSPSIVCAVKLEKAWKTGSKHTAGPVFSIQTLFTIAISAIDVAHHHPTEASGPLGAVLKPAAGGYNNSW